MQQIPERNAVTSHGNGSQMHRSIEVQKTTLPPIVQQPATADGAPEPTLSASPSRNGYKSKKKKKHSGVNRSANLIYAEKQTTSRTQT